MTKPLRNIIIEGVDRLGKGTLIEGLQQELGYFQVIHYEKPKLLKSFLEIQENLPGHADHKKSQALKVYQEASFSQMFSMLSCSWMSFIMDRAHLGETVYAPRYRKYGGDYVFELEDMFINYTGSDFHEATLLVLLTTSDFSFIQDDGMSFDFDRKAEEQEDFKRAFEKSRIKAKLLIDVSNGKGGYKDATEILHTVKSAFLSLQD